MKLESLKASKFEALTKIQMNNIRGGEDSPATTGTNPYDSAEKEHGKATSDCIEYGPGGEICVQTFWHADGTVSTWTQC